MYFVFGQNREVQAEIERNASTLVLIAVGIALVLLVIFLSFENAYGATLTSPPSLVAPCGSMEASTGDDGREIDLEQNSWRSELKNSPPEGWDLQSQ
jgi:hypothetical protein